MHEAYFSYAKLVIALKLNYVQKMLINILQSNC